MILRWGYDQGGFICPRSQAIVFLGNGQMRTLVAKEIADVWRSGTMFKMLGSYCVPLLFLLALAWMANFATNGDMPIPINLLSYAPFLGFFGFNFYSWLNAVDSPDFLNGLPVRVPQLLRAKIIVYFLMTTWISVLFLILMAHLLDQWVDYYLLSWSCLPIQCILLHSVGYSWACVPTRRFLTPKLWRFSGWQPYCLWCLCFCSHLHKVTCHCMPINLIRFKRVDLMQNQYLHR